MADDLAAWLRLQRSVGREAARRLLAGLGSAEAVFAAGSEALAAFVGPAQLKSLREPPEGWDALLEATLRWLAADGSRRIVTLADAAYPPLLLQTADPPLLLHLQGRVELLHAPSIAIVGSRNPSAQGADNARAFARQLGTAGYSVVSGLALGIDGAAHEGALQSAASTIAVVGTGMDRVYPARHRELAHRIAEQGLVVSEFALDTPPLAENFPQRNRIIAGLSLGTLVVEAALQSGSLITARLAAEAGREVFALPGSIHSPQSRGCHALIKQGAKLVESVEDILGELAPLRARTAVQDEAAAPAAGTAEPLLDALGHDPASLDALIARTGWPADRLNVRLLELELEGRVARLPGGLFQRRAAG